MRLYNGVLVGVQVVGVRCGWCWVIVDAVGGIADFGFKRRIHRKERINRKENHGQTLMNTDFFVMLGHGRASSSFRVAWSARRDGHDSGFHVVLIRGDGIIVAIKSLQ